MTEEQERLSQRGLSFVEEDNIVDKPQKLLNNPDDNVDRSDKTGGPTLLRDNRDDED